MGAVAPLGQGDIHAVAVVAVAHGGAGHDRHAGDGGGGGRWVPTTVSAAPGSPSQNPSRHRPAPLPARRCPALRRASRRRPRRPVVASASTPWSPQCSGAPVCGAHTRRHGAGTRDCRCDGRRPVHRPPRTRADGSRKLAPKRPLRPGSDDRPPTGRPPPWARSCGHRPSAMCAGSKPWRATPGRHRRPPPLLSGSGECLFRAEAYQRSRLYISSVARSFRLSGGTGTNTTGIAGSSPKGKALSLGAAPT